MEIVAGAAAPGVPVEPGVCTWACSRAWGQAGSRACSSARGWAGGRVCIAA